MFRFEKVPCTLQWHCKYVDLKKQNNSQFQLSWSRGSKGNGSTDLKKPGPDGKIYFDDHFECPCTMFVSKKDGATRQKFLRLTLRRFPNSQTQKLYGKLNIDIARYYGNKEFIEEEIEMESGRSQTPVLVASFKINQSGKKVEGNMDEDDISFMDPGETKPDLHDWDTTEIEKAQDDGKPVLRQSDLIKREEEMHEKNKKQKNKRKKHHKSALEDEDTGKKTKAKDHVSDDDEIVEKKKVAVPSSTQSDEIVVPKSEEDDTSHKKKKKKKTTEEPKTDDKHKNKKSKSKQKDEKKDERVSVSIELPEDKPKEAPPKKEKKKEEPVPEPIQEPEEQIDISGLIRTVLKTVWAQPSIKCFIDQGKRLMFPHSVYPIYSTLLYTKLLIEDQVNEERYNEAFTIFKNEFPTAPLQSACSPEIRFLTTVILALLINANQSSTESFSAKRKADFHEVFLSILNQTGREITTPLLINFEVLCNRYATAKYEVDPLLQDFEQVFEGIRSTLPYVDSLNRYLLSYFITLLDAKLLNKLITNPMRFCFTNAIIWNSFITAFEGVQHYPMKQLRQAVQSLVMAPNMCRLDDADGAKAIKESLCPDIELSLILYFLKNYHTDSMMQEPIPIKNFIQIFNPPDIATYGKVNPVDVDNFDRAGESVRLGNWSQCTLSHDVLDKFPYFMKYQKQ